MRLETLIKKVNQLQKDKAKAEEAKEKAKKLETKAQMMEEALCQHLLALRMGAVTLTNGTQFRVKDDPIPSVSADRMEDFEQWLRETGSESIIQKTLEIKNPNEEQIEQLKNVARLKRTIHHMTFKSWAREAEEKGTDLPDFVRIHRKRTLIVRNPEQQQQESDEL